MNALRWIVCCCAAFAVGCDFGPHTSEKPLEPDQEHLLALARAYRQFNTQQHRPPHSAKELGGALKKLGLGDEVLTSTRDGEPFVICWGLDVNSPPTWAKSRPVLGYEKTGREGKRYVVSTFPNVELLADEAFHQSSFPPGHKPPE